MSIDNTYARKGKKKSRQGAINIGISHQKKVINMQTGEVYNSLKQVTECCSVSMSHLVKVLKGRKQGVYKYYKNC